MSTVWGQPINLVLNYYLSSHIRQSLGSLFYVTRLWSLLPRGIDDYPHFSAPGLLSRYAPLHSPHVLNSSVRVPGKRPRTRESGGTTYWWWGTSTIMNKGQDNVGFCFGTSSFILLIVSFEQWTGFYGGNIPVRNQWVILKTLVFIRLPCIGDRGTGVGEIRFGVYLSTVRVSSSRMIKRKTERVGVWSFRSSRDSEVSV